MSFSCQFASTVVDFAANNTRKARPDSVAARTAQRAIGIVDDDINENPEVFFLVADVELEQALTLTKVCFKRHEKDPGCTDKGRALVRIMDNDGEYS